MGQYDLQIFSTDIVFPDNSPIKTNFDTKI